MQLRVQLQFLLGFVFVECFQDEITFHLYTGDKESVIWECDVLSLKSSGFNRRKATKIIVHGWTDSKDVPWIKEMKEVMVAKNRWNVIVVDWAPLSHTRFTEALEHSKLVATKLANFTNFLLKFEMIPPTSVHYIGHGLGVSVVGLAARTLRKSIGRITGLDPSSVGSSWWSRLTRNQNDCVLSKADAKFVDVIHTNGNGYGTMDLLGHVDYFPNGGKRQPGCGSSMCSHVRACEYWTASVKNIFAFKAYNYDLWERHLHNQLNLLPYFPMGLAANPTIPPGVYFVETTDRPPHVYKKHKFIR